MIDDERKLLIAVGTATRSRSPRHWSRSRLITWRRATWIARDTIGRGLRCRA